jgi:hypothetical protein
VRESRAVVITVSSVLAFLALIVAGLLFLPTLLLQPSKHESDESQRRARALIAQRIDKYATQVVSESTTPAGPSPVDLANLGDQASLMYTADRSGSALTALWVMASAGAGGLFGSYDVDECYTVSFHNLGTPAAGSQITHLPDCGTVLTRLKAQPWTPRPTTSSPH